MAKFDYTEIQKEGVDNVDDNQCLICGKKLKGKGFSVHMADGGATLTDTEVLDDWDDMGFFDVGADCAKKIPKEFLFERK